MGYPPSSSYGLLFFIALVLQPRGCNADPLNSVAVTHGIVQPTLKIAEHGFAGTHQIQAGTPRFEFHRGRIKVDGDGEDGFHAGCLCWLRTRFSASLA